MSLTFDAATHTYLLDGKPIPSVTRLIADPSFVCDPWYLERGTAVHKAIELLVQGDLDEGALDPRLLPYLEGFKAFMADVKPQIIASERRVFSRRYWYAGTVDLVVHVGTQEWVVDVKTGSVPPWADMQLEAYRQAIFEMDCTKPNGCRTLLLPGQGAYKLRTAGGPMAWASFRQILLDRKNGVGPDKQSEVDITAHEFDGVIVKQEYEK